MKHTLIVCGLGPGISEAVARRFGREGYALALVARNAERLNKAAASLTEAGITAKAFPCDLGDAEAVRAMVREVRGALGPVTAIHWNPYVFGAGDLVTANLAELRASLDVSLHGMLAAVQEAHADLKSQKGALLVTGGGLAFYDKPVNAMAVQWGAMGLAVAKAAQHKAVGLLHEKLAADGIYVGEVVVLGGVKGTAFDQGQATIEPSAVADRFWELNQKRDVATVNLS